MIRTNIQKYLYKKKTIRTNIRIYLYQQNDTNMIQTNIRIGIYSPHPALYNVHASQMPLLAMLVALVFAPVSW